MYNWVRLWGPFDARWPFGLCVSCDIDTISYPSFKHGCILLLIDKLEQTALHRQQDKAHEHVQMWVRIHMTFLCIVLHLPEQIPIFQSPIPRAYSCANLWVCNFTASVSRIYVWTSGAATAFSVATWCHCIIFRYSLLPVRLRSQIVGNQ